VIQELVGGLQEQIKGLLLDRPFAVGWASTAAGARSLCRQQVVAVSRHRRLPAGKGK